MSDDLEARGHHAITHDGETYIKLADASVTFSLYRKDIAAKDAEITRLRAALATARRDAMEQAAKWHDEQAARAQKLSDMKVSAEDEKVWSEYAENHREYAAEIRAAAKEGKP